MVRSRKGCPGQAHSRTPEASRSTARKIRNPQTNEMMKLKASKTVGFRPAKELKQTL